MTNPTNELSRQRRADVTRLYVRGNSLPEIAANLGLSDSAVAHELAEIRKEWVASSLRDRVEAKARELAKLDHVESEAWKAWERSQKKFTRVKTSEKKGKDKNCETITDENCETITETRSGEPKHMAAAQRAIELRMVILGLIGHRKSKAPAADTEPGKGRFTRLLRDTASHRARKANQDAVNQDSANHENGKHDIVNQNTPHQNGAKREA
ncbi:MAG TPA: hypothetical protein VND64_33710 [Pirellulales bacterium]|nr:hypothetical protein [Pirellulales bacterium]